MSGRFTLKMGILVERGRRIQENWRILWKNDVKLGEWWIFQEDFLLKIRTNGQQIQIIILGKEKSLQPSFLRFELMRGPLTTVDEIIFDFLWVLLKFSPLVPPEIDHNFIFHRLPLHIPPVQTNRQPQNLKRKHFIVRNNLYVTILQKCHHLMLPQDVTFMVK